MKNIHNIKKFPHFHTSVLQYSKYSRYPKKSAILSVFAVFAIFPVSGNSPVFEVFEVFDVFEVFAKENLSQEELNKILKEEYEKNKKLKKQNCWPTEPLKGTSSFYHFSHPVPLRGFFEPIFLFFGLHHVFPLRGVRVAFISFLACTMFSLLGVSGQPLFHFISAFWLEIEPALPP